MVFIQANIHITNKLLINPIKTCPFNSSQCNIKSVHRLTLRMAESSFGILLDIKLKGLNKDAFPKRVIYNSA